MDKEFIDNVISALGGMNVREYFLDQRQYDRQSLIQQGKPELECVAGDTDVVHDGCCGAYTERAPFDSSFQRCCNDILVVIGSGNEVDYC